MKNRIQLLRALKILSLLISILFLVSFCQKYMFVFFSDVKIRMDGFYLEDKNSLDVVIIGASETYNDFSPGLAYGEYGYTSYCIGSPEGSAALWKLQLKEVLKYQSPKLIVIEINSALFDDDAKLYEDAKLRQFTDNIPLSSEKIEALSSMPLQDEPISYYLPFIKYHGTNDFVSAFMSTVTELNMEFRGYSLLKGIYTNPKQVPPGQQLIDISDDTSTQELQPQSEQYLREFLEYCKGEDIQNVVFVRFPHRINSEEKYDRFCRGNRAGEIIAEFGYPFLNFEGKDNLVGLSPEYDYYDNDHLNIYGQQKFTRYLSEVLMNEYNLSTSSLLDTQASQWKNSYKYTLLFYRYVEKRMSEPQCDVYLFETYDLIQALEKME